MISGGASHLLTVYWWEEEEEESWSRFSEDDPPAAGRRSQSEKTRQKAQTSANCRKNVTVSCAYELVFVTPHHFISVRAGEEFLYTCETRFCRLYINTSPVSCSWEATIAHFLPQNRKKNCSVSNRFAPMLLHWANNRGVCVCVCTLWDRH